MKIFLTISTLILSFVAHANATRQLRSTCKVILGECYYSEWSKGCLQPDFVASKATEWVNLVVRACAFKFNLDPFLGRPSKFCCLKYVEIAYDPPATTTAAEPPQSHSSANLSEENSNESSADVTTVAITTAQMTIIGASSDSASAEHTSASLIATPQQHSWVQENGESQASGDHGNSETRATMYYRKHYSTTRRTYQKPKIIFPKRKPKSVPTAERKHAPF